VPYSVGQYKSAFRISWLIKTPWRCNFIKHCDICRARLIPDWCESQSKVSIGANLSWALKHIAVGVSTVPFRHSALSHLASLKSSVFNFQKCPWACDPRPSDVDTLLNFAWRGLYFWLASITSLVNRCPFFLTLAVLLQLFIQSVKLPPQRFAKVYGMWWGSHNVVAIK